MTMKPFEIQSPALSINGVLIDTSAQGKLVIPGVTRAGTSVAIEVEDTGDQTYSFGQNADPTTITIIDGYQFAVLNGDVQAQVGWTAATYAADEIDGEGFIDGISVVTGGAGYTGEAVTYSQQMLATEYADPLSSFDPGVWTWIPFRVRCGAGEITSEFGGGGASNLSDLNDTDISDPQDGEALVWNANDEVWVNASVSGVPANLGNLSVDGDTITSSNDYVALKAGSNDSYYSYVDQNPQYVEMYTENDNEGDNAAWVWINASLQNGHTDPEAFIELQDSTSGITKRWTFDKNGNINLPDNGDITRSGVSVLGGGGGNANTGDLLFEANTVYAAGTGFLNLQNPDNQVVIGSNNDSPLKVSVNENNGSKEWLFDTSGNLTLPPGGDILDSNGTSVLGSGGGGGPATALYTQNAGSVTGQQDNVAQGRYNIVIDAEKDVVINTDEDSYQFRFTNKGELKFPDGTLQPTAFNRDTPSHGGGNPPTLWGYGTQDNSDSATTVVEGFVAAARSVLVVASGVETNNGSHATITSITGMGLTWIRRALNIDQRSGSTQQAELWYAVNNTDTELTDDITITFDNTFDDQSTIVSNYLGCDLNNPWTNAGPYTSNSVNGDGYPEVTMNIYESGTMAIAFMGIPDSQTIGYVYGWNGVVTVNNSGAEYWEYASLSTNAFTDPQNSLTITGTEVIDPMNNQSTFGLTMIADALVSAGPGKLDRIINPNNENMLRINNNGDAVFDGPVGGVERGLRWNYGSNNSGVDSFVRQDEAGLTVQAYSDDFWTEGAPVIIRNGDNTQWRFGPSNEIELPNGTLIGSYDGPNGIDLKATSSHDYAQLNYNEEQYVWVETGGAFIQTNAQTGIDNAKTWIFDKRGQMIFPDGTKQQTAYVQRNINLDGGGAMAHYDVEVDVAFVDGGFSSTRHGVADASFDGGNRNTEVNQYNLDGGGA